MKHFELRSTKNNSILFQGNFTTFTKCLEQAISDNVRLHHADLNNQNLSNANLDDAKLAEANFTNTNLSGANMSEAYLKGARFYNAALYNTCFCDSNLTACNFDNATFGGTDIFGAVIDKSQFSTLSAFTLDFGAARQMLGCIFITRDGKISRMSKPPIVINGMGKHPIVIMDDAVHSGHNLIDHKRLLPIAQKLSARTLRKRLRA